MQSKFIRFHPPQRIKSKKNWVGGEERSHRHFIKRKSYPESWAMPTRDMPCSEHNEGDFLPTRKFVLAGNRTSDLEWVCHRAGLATWPPNLRQRIKSREIYFYLSLKFFCSNVLWPTLKIKIRGSLVFFWVHCTEQYCQVGRCCHVLYFFFVLLISNNVLFLFHVKFFQIN